MSSLEFEIKTSKSGLPVPFINGVLLHSLYNPEREAELFAAKQDETIQSNNLILIMGLGFGYHITSLERRLKTLYKSDYQICVIEPNAMTYEYWNKHLSQEFSENVQVFHYSGIDDYFSDLSLLNFLSRKPSIITHFASFNLYQSFFKAFLSYKYSTKIEDNLNFITNKQFHTYLDTYKELETDTFLESLKNKNNMSEWDFLCLAFSEIVHYKSPVSEDQI